MVECQLPKLKVAGSNPVSRSKKIQALRKHDNLSAFLFLMKKQTGLAKKRHSKPPIGEQCFEAW